MFSPREFQNFSLFRSQTSASTRINPIDLMREIHRADLSWSSGRHGLPRPLSLQQHIEQVVLEVDVAGKVLVIHAQKKSVRQREEHITGTRHRWIQRLARQQRRDRKSTRLNSS